MKHQHIWVDGTLRTCLHFGALLGVWKSTNWRTETQSLFDMVLAFTRLQPRPHRPTDGDHPVGCLAFQPPMALLSPPSFNTIFSLLSVVFHLSISSVVSGFSPTIHAAQPPPTGFRMASIDNTPTSSSSSWQPQPDASQEDISLSESLSIWPLDSYNVDLLNEVRHRKYVNPDPLPTYDLVVIGAGAGGLVSSRQVRGSLVVCLLLCVRCIG